MWNKGLLILVIGMYGTVCIAQESTLPALDKLELSLTDFTLQELDSKLKSFDVEDNADWQELLPSVGIAYTPTGAPRPSANWSPLQFLDRKDKKKKSKAEREAIKLGYELILYDRLHKLRQLYQDYLIDKEIMGVADESMDIEEKLFSIEKEKYEQHIIKPSVFLKSKKKILDLRSKRKLETMHLAKQIHALRYEAKWNDEKYLTAID